MSVPMRDRQFPFTSSTLPASELSPTLTAIRLGRSTPQAPTPHALCSTTVPAHSNEPCITVRMPSDGKSTPHTPAPRALLNSTLEMYGKLSLPTVIASSASHLFTENDE